MKSFKKAQRSLALAVALGFTCASPSASALELPSLSGLLESLLGSTGLLGTNTLAGANVLNSLVDVGATPSLIGADVITANEKFGSVVDANILTKQTTSSPTGTSLIGADVIGTGATGTLLDANVLSKNASITSAATPLIGADVLSSNTGSTGTLIDANILSTSDAVPSKSAPITINILSKNGGTGTVLDISLLSTNDTSGGSSVIVPVGGESYRIEDFGWGKPDRAVAE